MSMWQFEDAQHFFFHWGNYQLHRTVLIDAVSQYQNPSLNLLLYDDKALSPEINITIFENLRYRTHAMQAVTNAATAPSHASSDQCGDGA